MSSKIKRTISVGIVVTFVNSIHMTFIVRSSGRGVLSPSFIKDRGPNEPINLNESMRFNESLPR